MSLWIELSRPCHIRPRIESAGGFTGFVWGYLRIGYIPHGLNEFVQGLASVGAEEARTSIGEAPTRMETK